MVKVFKLATWLLSHVAIAALFGMVGLIVVDVVLRNLFNHPLYGTYEVVSLLLVPVAFFLVPDRVLNDGNIIVELIDSFAGPRTVHALKIAARVVMVIFFALLGWLMLDPLKDMYSFDRRTYDLELPLVWQNAALYFAILAGLISSIVVLVREVRSSPPVPEQD